MGENQDSVVIYSSMSLKASSTIVTSFIILALMSAVDCGSKAQGNTLGMLALLAGGATDENEITSLNIEHGNSSFVLSDSSLAQLSQSGAGSPNSITTATDTARITTDSEGNHLNLSSAIKVNNRYVFLAGLRRINSTRPPGHFVIDLITGSIRKLQYFPSYPAKIFATDDMAYYVSGSTIVETDLASGRSTIVSSRYNYWRQTAQGYNNELITGWNGSTWLFLDGTGYLYAVQVDNFSNSYTQGMGARFLKVGGTWNPDSSFNQTFLPSMPMQVADQFPGSLLANDTWILTDPANRNVYKVRASGQQITVKEFNIATWSDGSQVASLTLQNALPALGTTFLGYQPNLQASIITDGHEIVRLSVGTSGFQIVEIIAPASIPVTTSINWPGAAVSAWGPGAVTNWRFLNDRIYFLKPSDGLIYAWDMDPANPPTAQPIGTTSKIKFLY
ncbi:MAG: hypothetical protein K8S54_05875 [Spirochaetia bacterium]|nr:hypothetical protein [Spirochaetia bacterium]